MLARTHCSCHDRGRRARRLTPGPVASGRQALADSHPQALGVLLSAPRSVVHRYRTAASAVKAAREYSAHPRPTPKLMVTVPLHTVRRGQLARMLRRWGDA